MVPSFLSILVLAAGYWLWHLAARSPDRRCGWHGVWRVACLIGTVRICALWLGRLHFAIPVGYRVLGTSSKCPRWESTRQILRGLKAAQDEPRKGARTYCAVDKFMDTSALSASSTLNMGRGARFMKLATKVSGICWMRMLKVFTESL